MNCSPVPDDLRDVFDGLRWIVRSHSRWRHLPGDGIRARLLAMAITGLAAAGLFARARSRRDRD